MLGIAQFTITIRIEAIEQTIGQLGFVGECSGAAELFAKGITRNFSGSRLRGGFAIGFL